MVPSGLSSRKKSRTTDKLKSGNEEVGILSEIFCWWGGNTWGTRWTIAKIAEFVGEDEFGNRYYEQRKGVGIIGRPAPLCHLPGPRGCFQSTGGLARLAAPHGRYAPTKENYQPKPWQKPHEMNMTGTSQAYRPDGSILTPQSRPKATGDYSAWRPE